MSDFDIYSCNKVGNVVEVEPLFGQLSPENILLQVVEVHRTSTVFEVSYFGVSLGRAIYDAAGGWEWELK